MNNGQEKVVPAVHIGDLTLTIILIALYVLHSLWYHVCIHAKGVLEYSGPRESKPCGTLTASFGGGQLGAKEGNILGESKALLGGWPCKGVGLGGARGGSLEAEEGGGPRGGEGGGPHTAEGVGGPQAGSQLPGRISGRRPTSGWV